VVVVVVDVAAVLRPPSALLAAFVECMSLATMDSIFRLLLLLLLLPLLLLLDTLPERVVVPSSAAPPPAPALYMNWISAVVSLLSSHACRVGPT
jgi:hypothetical protein